MPARSVWRHNYGATTTYPGHVTHDKSAEPPDDRERWAELADLALIISREIQLRGYADPGAVALSQSVGMVMRYLIQGQPTATPSRIAAGTGLQRTNLSTVLRGLEEKGLVERRARPGDGRGVTVHVTSRGRRNYSLVRGEWAAAVEAAAASAGHDATGIDAALALLTAVKDGLIRARPRQLTTEPYKVDS